jgi:capsular exopolysaccharide synthesis family protein
VDDVPEHTTFREYLALLRGQRSVVLVPMVVGIVLALGLSVQQTPRYSATAGLVFQDESEALGLVGTPSAPSLSPDQRAARAADTLVTRQLLTVVRASLKTNRSVGQLTGALSTAAKPLTNIVEVTAEDDSASFAAALANATVRDAARAETARVRDGYRTAARRLREEFKAQGASKDTATEAIFASRISQLIALSTVSQPVDVARLASVPASPVSPKPVRNAVIAGMLGLLIGIFVAFIRNALDRRLTTSAEIVSSFGFPVLGHVRQSAMGYVGQLARGRPPLDHVDLEGFRILRTNLESLGEDGAPRCIAVTSGLAEEGKSTVAGSLAAAIAVTGRKVVLVECDLRRPALAGRIGFDGDIGLSAYLTDEATPAQVLRVVAVPGPTVSGQDDAADDGHSFVCIPAGRSVHDASEVLGSERFKEFLTDVREAYDVVLIDTAPLLAVADTSELLRLADAVLLCVRSGQTTQDEAQAVSAVLRRLPEKPVGIVVTGVERRHEAAYGYYTYGYDPVPRRH